MDFRQRLDVSTHNMRFWLASLIILFQATVPAICKADVPSPTTAVAGLTSGGQATIVWLAHGGDFRTTYSSGAYTEIWFSSGVAIHRGPSGETYPLVDVESYQAARILLTRQFEKLPLITRSTMKGPPDGLTMQNRGYPGYNVVRILTVTDAYGNLRTANAGSIFISKIVFDGNAALSWDAIPNWQIPFVDYFDGKRVDPPQVRRPTSSWSRPPYQNAEITASVNGRRGSVVVDTANGGILISRAFAQAVGAVVMSDGFVELRDAEIAGIKASHIFARLASNDRYDIHAGIRIFPDSSIRLRSDGRASLVETRCKTGTKFAASDQLIFGNLFDTLHIGPPLSIGDEGQFIRAHQARPPYNWIVGFDSLKVKQITVDTGNSLVCN